MMIRVRYQDGKTEMVRPPLLNLLIERRRIVQFRRDHGWAELGRDPIRQSQVANYQGTERRS